MKLRNLATVAALALAAGLAACATPTPYQPAVRGSAVGAANPWSCVRQYVSARPACAR